MPKTRRQPKRTIHLAHGKYDRVKITDRKNDVFFMGLGAAIKACKIARQREVEYSQDALELLVLLEDFAAAHANLFAGVAFRAESGRLHLYFSSPSVAFDVRLSEKLAQFETDALDRLVALRVDTRQVSAEELEEMRQLSTQQQNAQHSSAHQHVEAK